VDGDPYASHLRLRLLPESTSAINAQVRAAPSRQVKLFVLLFCFQDAA